MQGIRWCPQHDMDTIKERVLKALHGQKSPILIERMDITLFPDDDTKTDDG